MYVYNAAPIPYHFGLIHFLFTNACARLQNCRLSAFNGPDKHDLVNVRVARGWQLQGWWGSPLHQIWSKLSRGPFSQSNFERNSVGFIYLEFMFGNMWYGCTMSRTAGAFTLSVFTITCMHDDARQCHIKGRRSFLWQIVKFGPSTKQKSLQSMNIKFAQVISESVWLNLPSFI